MNSNIFQIESEYLQIIDAIEANDGEITPELEELLTINEENRDRKMEAYINVIRQKQADIELAKDEIDRLRKLSESNDKAINRLKQVLLKALETFDLRNKTGNLSHRLPNGLIYTRTTEAVELKVETLTYDEAELYPDVVNFVINQKLSKEQFDIVKEALEKVDIDYVNYNIVPSKTAFKNVFTSLYTIEDEETRNKEAERLRNFAVIKENVSLTIR